MFVGVHQLLTLQLRMGAGHIQAHSRAYQDRTASSGLNILGLTSLQRLFKPKDASWLRVGSSAGLNMGRALNTGRSLRKRLVVGRACSVGAVARNRLPATGWTTINITSGNVKLSLEDAAIMARPEVRTIVLSLVAKLYPTEFRARDRANRKRLRLLDLGRPIRRHRDTVVGYSLIRHTSPFAGCVACSSPLGSLSRSDRFVGLEHARSAIAPTHV
jgi:hypothetical protein